MKPLALRLLRVVALVFSLAAPMAARAATPVWDEQLKSSWGNWALGPVVGQMMGVSAKYWELKKYALDAGAGYTWDRYLVVHADYLFQFPNGNLIPYFGTGAEYSYRTDTSKADKGIAEGMTDRTIWGGAGVRFPLGFEWLIPARKLGVFAEFVPGLGVIPELFTILRGGAGVRVYF